MSSSKNTGKSTQGSTERPSVTEEFGGFFSGTEPVGSGSGVPHSGSAPPAVEGGAPSLPSKGGNGGVPGGSPYRGASGAQGVTSGQGTFGFPNLGLQRRTGRKRVVGGSSSLRASGEEVRKSYVVGGSIQFNDVEELRSDAISRAFAQELLEKLWEKWGLDTASASVMRKAEDVVHALFVMRTASPDADYNVFVLLGGAEVNMQDLSDLLSAEEVTRRRFARAIADDIRAYISDPENAKLRAMLSTELGVKAEYAHLAFDGSTHCSGLSTNQVMFTKQLEHANLFDTQEVRDKLGSTQLLSTGQFQVNRGRGAFN